MKPEEPKAKVPLDASDFVPGRGSVNDGSLQWNCTSCTMINHLSDLACVCCRSDAPAEVLSKSGSWRCSVCTFVDRTAAGACPMCGMPRPAEMAASLLHCSPNGQELKSSDTAHSKAAQRVAVPLGEKDECDVCFERPKAVAFLCGHRFCEVCGFHTKITACPTCQAPITNRIRLFS
jgi:hypothetical protein